MLDKKELIKRIEQIRNFEGSEAEEDQLLEELEKEVTDPELSDYIYWSDESAEEIAERVLNYKPIILPPNGSQ